MGRSSIESVEDSLPPGFRFHPRDDELVCDYLMNKILTTADHSSSFFHAVPQLIEVDLHKSEPWEIPETANVGGNQWYFYTRRDKKYATGLRTNRATATGYWKATGKDRPVYRSIRGTNSWVIGMRKTLVFYRGRAPKGRKSDWVMHEFRVEGSPFPPLKLPSSAKEDWVLCRVFCKEKEDLSSKHVSNTLPPLMDDPCIAFGQSQTSNNLQVPCFSISSHNETMNYLYAATVSASVTVPEWSNSEFKICTGRSGEYDGRGVVAVKHEQNRGLLSNKLNSSSEYEADKLKRKDSSCEEFGVDGNHSSDRDSYLAEFMWRHQR